MGKYLFYGTGGAGIAVFLVGCAKHDPIPTNIGLVLLMICLLIAFFSKER
jgi:hypothetical protein